MNVRSVRAALLAATLLLLAQGANHSQPGALPDPQPDLASTPRGTDDVIDSLAPAARSTSVWQLLSAQR